MDDGSTDGTFAELEAAAIGDPRVKVVRLRRNFGQSAATQAGLDAAAGDVIVTMDGDLQNDPADIPRMLAKLDEGYDAVLGQRVKRQDRLILRKVPSLIANWLIRKVLGVPFKDFGCTLRAMRREVTARPGSLRRDAPLHHGTGDSARRERRAAAGAAPSRARPGSRSTTSRAPFACCST